MALLTISQVAKKTGVSYGTIWGYVKSGRLKAVKLAGWAVRIPDTEVDKLMQRYKVNEGKITEESTEQLPEAGKEKPADNIEIV